MSFFEIILKYLSWANNLQPKFNKENQEKGRQHICHYFNIHLVSFAEVHDSWHINFIESGEHSASILGRLQSLSDSNSHSVHLNSALTTWWTSRPQSSWSRLKSKIIFGSYRLTRNYFISKKEIECSKFYIYMVLNHASCSWFYHFFSDRLRPWKPTKYGHFWILEYYYFVWRMNKLVRKWCRHWWKIRPGKK